MITHEERKMLYGSLPSNTTSPELGWWRHLHTAALGRVQAPPNLTFFLPYNSPLLFMILAVSYRNTEKKIGFWRNYYSCKLIWPCRSFGLERSSDPKIQPQTSRSSHCVITVVVFSVKLKQNSEMLQNQSTKKMSTELFPGHTQILFHPRVHHGVQAVRTVVWDQPAMALGGFNTRTREMVNASTSGSVLFPRTQGKEGEIRCEKIKYNF